MLSVNFSFAPTKGTLRGQARSRGNHRGRVVPALPSLRSNDSLGPLNYLAIQ